MLTTPCPSSLSAARVAKARSTFPRPTAGPLRPVVHCPTVKYNRRVRAGKGFSLAELKEAGIAAKLAPTIGIAVDHRRRNKSLEGLQANVQRLKAYKAQLVLFPRKAKSPKAGDASAEEVAAATQHKGYVMPIKTVHPEVEMVKITKEMQEASAYATLRKARSDARLAGKRSKAAAEAAAAEAEKAAAA